MRSLFFSLVWLALGGVAPAGAQNKAEDFGMTGIVVVGNGKFTSAASVLPHSPAADAGIKAGDTILAINGINAADLGLNEVASKIRGKPDTEVVLALMSHETGVAFSCTLKRVSSRAYHEANPSN